MSTNDIRKVSATAALGATVLAVGALAGQMYTAPTAHADRTVSAQEICSEHGFVARAKFFPPPVEGWCVSSLNVAPGLPGITSLLWVDGEGPIANRVPPGSHMVNPIDPLSDWVIPG